MVTFKSFLSPRRLIFIVLAMLPAILVAFFSQQRLIKLYEDASAEQIRHEAILIADFQSQVLESTHKMLTALAAWIDVDALDHSRCSLHLNALLFRNEGFFQNIIIASPQGEVLCSGQPVPQDFSLERNVTFKQVLRTQAFALSNANRDALSNVAVLDVGYPISPAVNVLSGVIIANVQLSGLNTRLGSLTLREGSALHLIDANGVVLASQPVNAELRGSLIPGASNLLNAIGDQKEKSIIHTDADGVLNRSTIVRLSNPYSGYVVFSAPETHWVTAIKYTTGWAWFTILLSMLLFFLIITGIFLNYQIKPLRRILEATEALAGGDTSVEVSQIPGTTDITRLFNAIIRLINTTKQKQEEQQAAERTIRLQEMQFHAIADLSINWEYWINPDGSYGYVSPACERISGYRGDEFQRDWEMLQTIVHPEDREIVTNHMKNDHMNERSQISELEFRILTKDGKMRWLYHTCQPVLNAGRQFIGRRAVNQDITERKKYESALRSSEERNREIIENYGEGIIIVNADEVITFMNPVGEQILGVAKEVILGHNVREYLPVDALASMEWYVNLGKTGQRTSFDMDFIHPNGQRFTLLITANPQMSAGGEYSGTIGTFRDITDMRLRETELRYASTHDGLTGLFNRQHLMEEMTRIENGCEWPVSIIVVDMDDLKKINDVSGHIAGDDALKRTAALLKSAMRPGDFIARYGGDEFVILLPGIGAQAGGEIYERIESALAAHNVEHPDQTVKVSLGIATGEQGSVLKEIFRRADEIMYENKQNKTPSTGRLA